MTDRERKVKQLRRLIKAAHNENYDFIYLPVGDAKTVVRLLEDQVREEGYHEKAVLFGDRAGTQRSGVDAEGPGKHPEADVQGL